MLTVETAGAHRQMGRQHARQVRGLLPRLHAAMSSRQAELARLTYDFSRSQQEAADFMAAHGAATWDMLRGIGEGLGLDWSELERYTLSSYLLDYAVRAGAAEPQAHSALAEGCTTFAAAPPATAGGQVLLAKNRDYRRDHIPLQILGFAQPQKGYRYLHIGSAGSPGVFSSGMNERGLAVVDTHVGSSDLGPGLPRYALMMDVLEQCATVADALSYLQSVTHMGGGTITLADSQGDLAVCESAHSGSRYRRGQGGWLVSANHFVEPDLQGRWVENEPPGLTGNSPARYALVAGELAAHEGQIDLARAQALLARHAGELASICRHERPGIFTSSILATVFLPRSRTLWLAEGSPCTAAWQELRLEELEDSEDEA